MLINEDCTHHSTDIILFQARRSPFQPCLRLAKMLHQATKWVEESSNKEIGCHRKIWCRQCATAAIYRAIKLLPGQTDRPLPQLLTYGTNGAWKVLQAVLIGTAPLTRTMAWCHRCAATSLGKKILACNMDPPTVPLPSSVASHLPQIPSLPKNSVGTCQANYDPRGAAGLSHANALPNGILLITWMAGLTIQTKRCKSSATISA